MPGMTDEADAEVGFTENVPRSVVPGTTFTFSFLPIVSSGVLPVGFGADPTLNPGTALMPDLQRGNARFVLCLDPAPDCGTPLPLSLRFLTRLEADRGSPRGRRAALSAPSSEVALAHEFALIDVPLGTPPGSYQLTYALRRPGASVESFLTLQPITVVPIRLDDFMEAALRLAAPSAPSPLPALIPDPQLSLALVDMGLTGQGETLTDRPASGTVVLRHPPTVKIEGVFEADVLGQGSLVRVNPGPGTGTVSILFLDPDQRTTQLRVAFRPLPDATEPARPEQFSVESQRLYRADGSELPIVERAAESGNGFRVGQIF